MIPEFVPHFEAQYHALLGRLEKIVTAGSAETGTLETAYQEALRAWQEVAREIKAGGFCNKEAEIYFFKLIKPFFTGQIELYTHRYHALVFLRGGILVMGEKDFWKNEFRKITRFEVTHAGFIRYYHSGKKDMDEQYFLRSASAEPQFPRSNIYDNDPDVSAPYDRILALCIGYGHYRQFIEDQFKKPAG